MKVTGMSTKTVQINSLTFSHIRNFLCRRRLWVRLPPSPCGPSPPPLSPPPLWRCQPRRLAPNPDQRPLKATPPGGQNPPLSQNPPLRAPSGQPGRPPCPLHLAPRKLPWAPPSGRATTAHPTAPWPMPVQARAAPIRSPEGGLPPGLRGKGCPRGPCQGLLLRRRWPLPDRKGVQGLPPSGWCPGLRLP